MNVHRPEPKVWRTQTNDCNPGEGKGPGKGKRMFRLFLQFHEALIRHYTNMEQKLYDPSKMENVCDKHATGTLFLNQVVYYK